jgi:hypothetical protein
MVPLIAQVIDGALQVGRIPQNNGRDEQGLNCWRAGFHRSGRGFSPSWLKNTARSERILLLTLVEALTWLRRSSGFLQMQAFCRKKYSV